jgi:hypothetical protein
MEEEEEEEEEEEKKTKNESKQPLKRYVASGSHCPIAFYLDIGCRDGAAVGANDTQGNCGSTFLHFSVSPQLEVWRATWVS